jgi:hypothetical protein
MCLGLLCGVNMSYELAGISKDDINVSGKPKEPEGQLNMNKHYSPQPPTPTRTEVAVQTAMPARIINIRVARGDLVG